jgi:hypothetical protein
MDAGAPFFPGRLRRRTCIPLPTARKDGPLASLEGHRPATSSKHVCRGLQVWLEFNDVAKAWSIWPTSCTEKSARSCAIATSSRRFILDYGLASIAWLDGVDFAPEFLYERLKEMH